MILFSVRSEILKNLNIPRSIYIAMKIISQLKTEFESRNSD